MQILNLDADLNISRLDADIRTLRLGEGGTTNYNDLTNKPSINSVTLTGNKTTSDLNIKTSDLINDEGFITNADIPTKTSDLINDSGFQTAAQVSTAVAAAIPTNVSAFTNDAGYITAAQVGNIPTKTSDLTNDSGFITSAEAPVQSVNGYTGAVSLDGSNLDYSAALSINDKIDAVEAAIPTKTSDLTNDSGFITAAGVPSKTSDLINDSGFITSSDIPTDVSAFTNDAGYQTSADVNTLIQAAMPVTEIIENESIASFSDGADNVPVSELIVNITATQAGSGTPSPSNPRPISGHSSCTITVEDDIDDPQEVKTVTISLGNTYYGGTLNVTTGVLTVTHGYINYTGDISEAWYYTSSLNRVYIFIPDAIKSLDTPIASNIIAYNGSYTPSDYTGHINPQGNFEIFAPASITSASDWTTWVANNNIELVYKLDTPTTVQLTPTEVRTLLEDNNIFADTGDVNKLVYFKTGCEAIARLIEAYT